MILDKKNCFYLGTISKTKGVRGQLYAFLDTDNPEHYHQIKQILIEKNGGLIPCFLESFHVQGEKALIQLEGVTTHEEAKTFLKCDLYLPLTALPPLSGNKFYFHEILEFEVILASGEKIGRIQQVLDQKSNPLLSVMHPSQKEILIPIRDNFIHEVNRVQKTVTVKLPEGLLELYLEN